MKRIYASIAALAYIFASPAWADPVMLPCDPRAAMTKQLTEKFGETGVFQGLQTDEKAIWEIFARPDGTWTLFFVRPDGVACVMAVGEMWIDFGVPQGEAG